MATDFTVSTEDRTTVRDVTDDVAGALEEEDSGTVTAFVEHTTCAVTVNEAESRLLGDLASFLADLVPETGWAHDEIEDNADSHLRAALLGPSVTIPVDDGNLRLGTWQSVLVVECTGPRTRTVHVVTD